MTLIKADARKFNPLETVDDAPPATWIGSHVGQRMSDAFETLLRLPTTGGSASSGFWPAYDYEYEDLLAQQQQAEDEKRQDQQQRNRVRLSPSVEQITQMERTLYWPARYLATAPWLMRAVNAVSLTRALDRDIRWLARKRGGKASLWVARHHDGCEVIAFGLIRDKVSVF